MTKGSQVLLVYFLFCHVCWSQSISETTPTLDGLFELKWSAKGQSASANPLLHDGLLFETFSIDYAWNVETGEKVFFKDKTIKKFTKDSLVHFSSSKGIAIVNIYSGQKIYQSTRSIKRPWAERPRVIHGDALYVALNDSTLALLDFTGKVKWQKKFRGIYNLPIADNKAVYISDVNCLYALEKGTGNELWKIELGPFVSDPLIMANTLYCMTSTKGVVAVDLTSHKIKWQFKPDRINRNHELHIDRDSIFLTGLNLYAVSAAKGEVFWKNTDVESSETFVLTATKKYLLFYKSIDDYHVLTACRKNDGSIAYEAFTTIYDSQKDPKPVRPLFELEGKHFRFSETMYKGKLYAVDPRGNIYCFQVIE